MPLSLVGVAFSLIAFGLFANTFGNAWTYDDLPVIVNNPDILSLGDFFANRYPGRPLRELSFLLDRALFGLEPQWWHLQQIAWHVLNGLLLFVLACRLGVGRMTAFLVGLVFLVHPLQVEVVANLSHRKDSLALACALGSLLCYLRSADFDWGMRGRKLRWLLSAGVLWGLALLAKETATLLPLLFWGYELLWVPRERRTVGYWRWLPAASLSVLCAAFAGWLAWGGGAAKYLVKMQNLLLLKANHLQAASLSDYLAMVLKSWSFLFGKILWPADLAVEYVYPVPTSFVDLPVCLALAGSLAVVAAIVACRRRWPAVSFGLLWFVLFFLPTANLYPLSYFAADRYLYAPLCGVLLASGAGLEAVTRRYRPLLQGAVVVACLVMAGLTWQQNRVWRSEFALWEHAVRVSPDAVFARNNLGWAYLEKQDFQQAREHFQRATEVNPYFPRAWGNLAWIYERLGLRDLARDAYVRSLQVDWVAPAAPEKKRATAEHLSRQFGVDIGRLRPLPAPWQDRAGLKR